MFSFLMFCCLIFQFCYFNYVSRTRVKYLFRATSREYSAVAGVPCSDFLDYSGRYLGEAAEWARQELIERHLQQKLVVQGEPFHESCTSRNGEYRSRTSLHPVQPFLEPNPSAIRCGFGVSLRILTHLSEKAIRK